MGTAFQQENRRAFWHLVPPGTAAADPTDDGPQPEPTDLPTVLTDDDLDLVLRDYFGVKLPNTKCCQNHQTPWEAVHDAFFARSVVAIWKASRGLGGKSYTLSALAMAEALFLRADVNILGGSGVQSKRVLEAIQSMWAYPSAPKQCLIGEPGSQVQKLVWGNRIQALMASQASVRGPHPQRLRLDEVDEMKKTILDAALGQPMAKGWVQSHVVGASTHQYPDKMMTAMIQRALTTDGWKLFEWCYRENLEPHGWLSLAEVKRKQAILTVQMWNTEIELQEPSNEGRAIDTDKCEAAFTEQVPIDQGQHSVAFEAPVPEGSYATGADWAKKKNHTVIVTIRKDVRPKRVVKLLRMNKRPWPEMVKAYNDQAAEYGATVGGTAVAVGTKGSTQSHDNTGLGQVIADYITVDAEDFNMVGQARKDLLSNYVNAIERGDLIWPRYDEHQATAAARSEHKYATVEDLYRGSKDGSSKFHLPDTVSAGALAWRATEGVIAAGGVKDPPKDENPHLQAGIQRGRLSSYIQRGPTIRTDDDEDDEDGN